MSPQWASWRNCCTARLSTRPRHMMAFSSSARNPIDNTRTRPSPTLRSSGTIFPWRASTSPSMPRSLGTEKPQMSASRIPTVSPREARATARFTVTEDLPTPPFPDATASTRAVGGTSVSGASSRAFQRTRAMTAARSSASMAAMRTSTERVHSSASSWPTTSRSIWLRNGQEATVRATSTTTSPPRTDTPRTMPRSTTLSPSSGSITARRRSSASASRGPRASATREAGGTEPEAMTRFYLRGPVFRPGRAAVFPSDGAPVS